LKLRHEEERSYPLDNLNTHKRNKERLKAPSNSRYHFTPKARPGSTWLSILQGVRRRFFHRPELAPRFAQAARSAPVLDRSVLWEDTARREDVIANVER
jgi:hypothetical protein